MACVVSLFLAVMIDLVGLSQSSVQAREPVVSADPLPSWAPGKAKDRIVSFVKDVTDSASNSFVLVADRFATFDNDGTILCEKPTFFEAIYSRDHARAVQDKHPDWANNPGVQKVLKADDDALGSVGASLTMITNAQANAGATEGEIHEDAVKWLGSAKQKRFDVPFKKMYYMPMIELLNYLKANDFKVYLCTGGQAEFVRCYCQEDYGIDPAQVIGSSMVLEYTIKDGRSVLEVQPKMQSFNVGNNKPISISQHIGRRPVIACGNSDGDLQMLTYASDRTGPSLAILIHHDDAKREYQYDSGAEKVLPAAAQKQWLIVSMKDDFKRVFAFDK